MTFAASDSLPRWFFGLGADDIPAGAEVYWTWTQWPSSWRVFVALFAVAGLMSLVWRLYRAEAASLSEVRRRILAGVRMAVVLLLAITALGPAISYTQQRVLRPVVVVLRDASQSMATADVLANGAAEGATPVRISRAAVVNRSLTESPDDWRSRLAERGQLRVFDFAQAVTPVEPPADDAGWTPITPVGPGTNLHRALSEAMSERLRAAVVLFTDGQHTDRATGTTELLQLARRARAQNVPWLIVGLGDPQPPRNLEVSEIYADAQVWKDDPFELRAVVKHTGLATATASLELVEQQWDATGDRPGSERVLETRDVELAESGQQTISFGHTPTAAGRFTYTVRAAPLAEESNADDNQPLSPAEVKVLDDKARVLLVAGGPHWEYRFVSRLLEREASIDLSCWLQTLDPNRAQEGDTPIPHLPRTKEDLLAYDVVLLLDPDPTDFDDAWMQALTEFVGEHAGGLLYMAGPTYTTRFLTDPRTQRIASLLPVRLSDVAATEVSRLLESPEREWPVAVVEAQLDHPVLRFEAATAASREIWKLLPGIVWSFPVAGAVPTARVLLEHSDPAVSQLSGPRPLLVAGHFGAGRTLFVGFEGTWRWRQAGRNAEFFNRYWVQVARFLIEGRAVEGQRRGVVETERRRYEIGDRITVVAQLNDARYQPLDLSEVTAQWTAPGREATSITLRATPQQPGRYEAAVTADALGRNVLRIELPDATETGPNVEATFSVAPPSSETQRIWQDEPLLRELAAESGGRYFTTADLDSLPEAIPDRQQTVIVQGKPQPVWDTSRWLLLIVGLLVTEWALRKRWKLL
jgi:hypothetical protein